MYIVLYILYSLLHTYIAVLKAQSVDKLEDNSNLYKLISKKVIICSNDIGIVSYKCKIDVHIRWYIILIISYEAQSTSKINEVISDK